MKRKDDAILDVFADENSKIDSKFRANLKNQIIGSGKPAKRLGWAKYVWASAAFAAVIVAVTIVGLQRPGNHDPIGLQKVSAAELLRRADIAGKKFDFNKYTYFQTIEISTYGPAYARDQCDPNAAAISQNSSAMYIYVYKAHDNGIEAYYNVNLFNDAPVSTISVYDTTPKIAVSESLLPQSQTNLSALLGTKTGDSQPDNIIVDSAGNPLGNDRIMPTMQNGRLVYELYARQNSKSATSMASIQKGCFQDVVTRIVLDAKTYALLSKNEYAHSIDPSNLIMGQHDTYRYLNLNAHDALQEMTAAGFDKYTALPELISQGDGKSDEPY